MAGSRAGREPDRTTYHHRSIPSLATGTIHRLRSLSSSTVSGVESMKKAIAIAILFALAIAVYYYQMPSDGPPAAIGNGASE